MELDLKFTVIEYNLLNKYALLFKNHVLITDSIKSLHTIQLRYVT